jgi:site-specific DNA recombinase
MCKQYIFTKFDGALDADITVYEDEGFSAKNTDRPQFKRLISDIKRKKFDFVVCYRLDRISRNVSDFSALIEDLNDRAISFVCIKEEFDTSKPMGKAMMYIASVFAQLERETIAERVRDNMLMLARTGRWLGGTTPTGFTSEKNSEVIIDGKVKTSCKLKTETSEIAVVKMIFDKFAELHSISGVSKYLIKQNIKSRSDKIYSLPGIKEILRNPVYATADKDAFDYFTSQNADVCFKEKDCSDTSGIISYNKRDYKKKHAPRQPVEKWIIAIGKHKGVISGQKWVNVQNILDSNRPDGKRPAKTHNDYSLLSGLIFCEKCGSRMFAKSRNGNALLFDYICQSKMRGGTALCNCHNLGGQQTDGAICEYLMKYTNETSDIYRLLEKLKKELRENKQENPVAVINAQIKKRNGEMDNLITALSQNNPGTAFVNRVNTRITELDNELKGLAEEQKRLQNSIETIAGNEIQLDLISSALSSLKDNFKDLSIYEKRTLIKLLVQKIIWDGNDLHIFIYGE